jgi:PKD repeat protein
MDILLTQIILCGMFGLITGLVASFVLLERENTVFSVICSMLGLTTGMWVSILWIFLTGGTSINAIMVFVVVLTTIVILLMVLSQIKEITRQFKYRTNKNTTFFAFGGLVLLAFLLMFSTMPIYSSSHSIVDMTDTSLSFNTVESFVVDSTLAQEIYESSLSDGYGIISDIDFRYASLNFPRFSSSANVGDYLTFEITFNVGTSGGAWDKPYIKIAVFQDTDNSGTVNSGDISWSPYLIKAVTSTGKWRSQVFYENSQPKGQLTAIMLSNDDIIFMPIFHANTIEVWKDDNGKKFPLNTPSGYTAPYDQMSWELVGDGLSLKEDISAYAVVNKGGSVTVKGQLYCDETFTGSNLLWVGAYDLNYQQDPFSVGLGENLKSKTSSFTITGGTPGGPTVSAGGPYSGTVGQSITFTGSASGGTPPYTQWKWTFSDGTTQTGQTVSKSFVSAGSHSASLTVTDSASKTGTASATVTITGGTPGGPTVSAGGPYSGTVGQSITFTGSASGGTPPYTQWKWTFSDGTTQTGQTVSKSFVSAGSHSASLTVTDSASKTGTASATVTISEGSTPPVIDDIDISTYIVTGCLSLGCIGAVVYGRKYL